MRALSSRRSTRQLGDEGFTILEVVVSIALIGMVMAAVSTVFYSSLRTAGASSFRSAGAALATRETEAIHAIPYDAVGFYTDQSPPALAGGGTTVILGPTAPAGVLVTPTGFPTIGPITYSVTRHLTWADTQDAAGTPKPEAYKKTTVFVTWTDTTGTHTARQDSIFYPGGQGIYAGAGSGITTTTTTTAPSGVPSPPTALIATVPIAPDGYSSVDLSWTAPVPFPNHYRVEASTDSGFVVGVISGTSIGTSKRITGLSSGEVYYFRVYSVSTVSPDESGSSIASSVVTASTLTPPPPPPACSVSSMVLSAPTDGGANLTSGGSGKLNEPISVTLTLNSAPSCSSGAFKARAETVAGTKNPSSGNPITFLESASSSSTRTVTWPAGGVPGWSAGDHKVVLVNAAGTPVTPAVFLLVRICNFGVSPC